MQELWGQEKSKQVEAFVDERLGFVRVYTWFSFFLSGYFCVFVYFFAHVFIRYDYIDLICKQFWQQDCNSSLLPPSWGSWWWRCRIYSILWRRSVLQSPSSGWRNWGTEGKQTDLLIKAVIWCRYVCPPCAFIPHTAASHNVGVLFYIVLSYLILLRPWNILFQLYWLNPLAFLAKIVKRSKFCRLTSSGVVLSLLSKS